MTADKSLGLSVTARADGALEAAYIKISDAQVARTQELIEAVLLADFDHHDQLVGVEILAPVPMSEVLRAADMLYGDQKEAYQRFVRSSAPRELVTP